MAATHSESPRSPHGSGPQLKTRLELSHSTRCGVYALGRTFPLGNEDIAKVVAFLASDDSGWLTGEVLLCLRRTALVPIPTHSLEKIMPAYMVFMREKTLDRAELEAYWEKVLGTLDGRPLKPLAAYGRHLTLEGLEVEGVVIAEFRSLEEARDWYYSPAYQEVAQHRHRGAVYRGLIVEGV